MAWDQKEFEQHFPGPGQVEHDAEEIWATQWRSAEEAYEAAGRPEIRDLRPGVRVAMVRDPDGNTVELMGTSE